MRVMMIGDVVGTAGREFLERKLPALKRDYRADAVVVNAENVAAGSGITAALAGKILAAGADAITLGDHTWAQKGFNGEIGMLERVVRPANYPVDAPGRGWCLVTTPLYRFAVLNLQGRVFMQPVDCPFRAADKALKEIPQDVPVVVDFHAEATSEKVALAAYLDGRVAMVAGTHTHVQTSDARVLANGTGFITDLGMTGPYVSSIGRELKPVIKKFLTGMPFKFEVAAGPCTLEGMVVEVDALTRRASKVEAFRLREERS